MNLKTYMMQTANLAFSANQAALAVYEFHFYITVTWTNTVQHKCAFVSPNRVYTQYCDCKDGKETMSG